MFLHFVSRLSTKKHCITQYLLLQNYIRGVQNILCHLSFRRPRLRNENSTTFSLSQNPEMLSQKVNQLHGALEDVSLFMLSFHLLQHIPEYV